jgi:tetratricopeptide (TPR) repeat protein
MEQHFPGSPDPGKVRPQPGWRRRIVPAGAIALILCLGGLGWYAWREIRSELLLRQANASYDRRDWSGALRSALEQLELRPGDPRGSSVAARSLSRLNRAGEAEAHYAHAGPLAREDRQARALALIRANRTEDAAKVYEEMLRLWPDDPLVLRRLAAVRIGLGQWTQAAGLAERMIREPSTELVGQCLAGAIYHNTGQFRQAIAADLRVLQLDPELRQIPLPVNVFWSQLGNDLVREGRTSEARDYLNRGLSRGDDPALLEALGQAYMKDGEVEEAESAWRRAMELAPDRCDPWLNLGRLAMRRNQLAEAVRLLERAAALSPASPEPLYSLSQAHRLLGHSAEADRVARRLERIREAESTRPTP